MEAAIYVASSLPPPPLWKRSEEQLFHIEPYSGGGKSERRSGDVDRGGERGFPAMTLPPPPPSLPPSSFKPPSPPSSSTYIPPPPPRLSQGRKKNDHRGKWKAHTHIYTGIYTYTSNKSGLLAVCPCRRTAGYFLFSSLLLSRLWCQTRTLFSFPLPPSKQLSPPIVLPPQLFFSPSLHFPISFFSFQIGIGLPRSPLLPFNPFLLASRLNAYIYSSRGRDKRLFPSFGKAAVFHFFFPPFLSPRPSVRSIAVAIVAAPPFPQVASREFQMNCQVWLEAPPSSAAPSLARASSGTEKEEREKVLEKIHVHFR